jgi:hypothetical protein
MSKVMPEPEAPFSHSEHLRTMFGLYVQTKPLRDLLRRVTMDELRMVFNAGYVEGMWSERTHPGGDLSRQRRPVGKRSR